MKILTFTEATVTLIARFAMAGVIEEAISTLRQFGMAIVASAAKIPWGKKRSS